ncbi:hypothetical protein C5167_026544 [Papaver somniferum]|nr:hypothetical protein C5167_026544 [Papaver somniferum]
MVLVATDGCDMVVVVTTYGYEMVVAKMVSALGLVIEVSALGLKCGGEALVIVKLPPGDSCAAVIPLHPQYCDNHCQNACPVGLKLGVAPCVDNLISVGYAYCGCCCIPI